MTSSPIAGPFGRNIRKDESGRPGYILEEKIEISGMCACDRTIRARGVRSHEKILRDSAEKLLGAHRQVCEARNEVRWVLATLVAEEFVCDMPYCIFERSGRAGQDEEVGKGPWTASEELLKRHGLDGLIALSTNGQVEWRGRSAPGGTRRQWMPHYFVDMPGVEGRVLPPPTDHPTA